MSFGSCNLIGSCLHMLALRPLLEMFLSCVGVAHSMASRLDSRSAGNIQACRLHSAASRM